MRNAARATSSSLLYAAAGGTRGLLIQARVRIIASSMATSKVGAIESIDINMYAMLTYSVSAYVRNLADAVNELTKVE